MPGKPIRRRAGRPPAPGQNASNTRAVIVEAASRHFAEHGIKATTNAMIAQDAGVTPAMVHYYFRRRELLYQAILEDLLTPLLNSLPGMTTLDAWVAGFHDFLAAHPWAPKLMLREIFMHNGLLRPLFLKHYAPAIFGQVRQLLQQELGSTGREELDVERHFLLLQSMLVYPFLSIEVSEKLTGRKFDKAMLAALRDDALALFRHGIHGRPKRRGRQT